MPVTRTLRTALFLLALTVPAALTHADATTDARKAVQTAYSKETAAVMKKDMKSIFAAYTPDFVQIMPNGAKMSMTQIKQITPQMLAMAQNIKDKIVVRKFSAKGNKATATVQRHTELTMVNPQNQQPAKVVVDAVSTDTWQKNGKGWMLKLSKALSEKQTMNGKPLPTSK